MVERSGARMMRGLVKFIFIGCYAAFMWASIHHVAYFFNNFEQESSGGIGFGSYVLAGAFDLTALISTIAVMFFRKNMSGGVLWIVWFFILGIAAYSYLINWEYSFHFQGPNLTLEPTGATTPVYDAQGTLHYVPVMRQNQTLLVVNPLLASGFVLFSLIYSIVAEFFGTKLPTVQELQAQRDYLEQTKGIADEIKRLEGDKGPGFVERAKQTALQVKGAVGEVTKRDESGEGAAQKEKTGFFTRRRGNKETLEAMKTLLVGYGWKTVEQVRKISLEEAQLFLVAVGVWDASTGGPTEAAMEWKELRTEALARKWLSQRQITQERELPPAQIQARYTQLMAQLQEQHQFEAAQAEHEIQGQPQAKNRTQYTRWSRQGSIQRVFHVVPVEGHTGSLLSWPLWQCRCK